jgi:hypothetical protein
MLVSQRSYFGCARSLPARTDAKIDPELSERGAELKLSSSQRRRRFRHATLAASYCHNRRGSAPAALAMKN